MVLSDAKQCIGQRADIFAEKWSGIPVGAVIDGHCVRKSKLEFFEIGYHVRQHNRTGIGLNDFLCKNHSH